MMINGRLQAGPITGYYEYLSQNRHRVNVTPHERRVDDESMIKTNTQIHPPTSNMENEVCSEASNLTIVDDQSNIATNFDGKEVTKWTSLEVQQWIEEQCQKFELKKATSEQFQMNGQALVLLTKHDFLRRSPDGGEILYYALQRLINPKKFTALRNEQNTIYRRSSSTNARIVELSSDVEEGDGTSDSSSSIKPIIEEPDDPPINRKPDVEGFTAHFRYQTYPQAFMYAQAQMRPHVYAMPTNTFYHPQYQQQAYANNYVYTHPHHHAHSHSNAHHHHPHHLNPHMTHQQFYQTHGHHSFIHQYHPMMSAQGIVIELLDNETKTDANGNGTQTGTGENPTEVQQQLYLVTINGQRQVMNEDQVRQLIVEVQQQQQQQQTYQNYQQNPFHQQQAPSTSTQQAPPPTIQENIYYNA